MAVRKIETSISLDGEQQFKKALTAATREMRVMESELKAVSAAYDVNGNSAQYFAAKQQNLQGQIAQQREIIRGLERAVEEAGKAYGESSSQVDGYAIRLNNARTRMARLEKELEATDREVEELGRDSVRAGRQLEEGIGEGADNAESSLKSLISTMQQDISSIRTSSAVSAVTGLWDLATGAYGAMEGFVSGTAEYRRQLSFLAQNAETKGFDFDAIKKQLIEVQALTGDSSSAVEGLSNLLAADVDERQLTEAVELLAGAVISFPETLKFESLADGLQETIATGSATGAFAEALERLGVDVEEFNKALEESDTTAGDLDIALAYLAANGMADVYKKWLETNGAMSEAQKTQAELEMELSLFAGTVEEYISTPIKQVAVDAMRYINEVIAAAKESGLEGASEKVVDDMAQVATQQMEAQGRPQEEIDAANALLHGQAGNEEMAILLKARSDEFGQALTNGMKSLEQLLLTPFANEEQADKNATEEAKAQFAKEAEDFEAAVRGWQEYNDLTPQLLTENAAKVVEIITQLFKDREQKKEEAPEAEVPELTITGPGGEELMPIGTSDNWKEILAGITADTEAAVPEIEAAAQAAGEALSTGLNEGAQGAEEANPFPTQIIIDTQNAIPALGIAGSDAGDAITHGFEESVRETEDAAEEAGDSAGAAFEGAAGSYEAAAYRIGVQIGAGYASGIESQYGRAFSAAARLAAGASAGLGGAQAGFYGGTYGPQPAGNINAVLNIDGRTFAKVTAPYLSGAMSIDV